MRCCSFRAHLCYSTLCASTRATIHVWSLCVCVPRCTCTNCRTIRVQTSSVFISSVFFSSSLSLPPAPPPTSPSRRPPCLTPFYVLLFSFSVFHLFFLVSPSRRAHMSISFGSVHTYERTRENRNHSILFIFVLVARMRPNSEFLCHDNGVIQGSARARARNT